MVDINSISASLVVVGGRVGTAKSRPALMDDCLYVSVLESPTELVVSSSYALYPPACVVCFFGLFFCRVCFLGSACKGMPNLNRLGEEALLLWTVLDGDLFVPMSVSLALTGSPAGRVFGLGN